MFVKMGCQLRESFSSASPDFSQSRNITLDAHLSTNASGVGGVVDKLRVVTREWVCSIAANHSKVAFFQFAAELPLGYFPICQLLSGVHHGFS